jgi:hypothetical protein
VLKVSSIKRVASPSPSAKMALRLDSLPPSYPFTRRFGTYNGRKFGKKVPQVLLCPAYRHRLGVAALFGHCQHPVADLQTGHLPSECRHHAGGALAGDKRKRWQKLVVARSRISSRSRHASPATLFIESNFEVGHRFRCTMRVDCGELDARAVIRPEPSEWRPRMPECLDEEELADWRAGGNAVYQLAALTIGARLAVADG